MISYEEHTFLISDSVWRNILSVVVFLSILCVAYWTICLRKRKGCKESSSINDPCVQIRNKIICKLLMGIIALMAVLFVLSTQREARADQSFVQTVVNQWISRDFTCFDKGAYLDKYPNQAGIILVCYYFSFIFGTRNYLAFQLVNVISLVLIYKELGDIIEKKTGRVEFRTIVYLFGLLFLPGVMYTGFVYGNIIGLALSLVAFRHILLYIEEQKNKNALIAAISIFGAIAIKQNYLIFAVALLLFLLFELVRKFSSRLMACFTIVMLIVVFSGSLINEGVYLTTGRRLSSGASKWSWITMGLMENDSLYDGWWNSYNTESYAEAEFNTERQEEKNKEDLVKRLKYFAEKPEYAIRFLAGKNASQWNNPNFQAVWVNQRMPQNGLLRQPKWVISLINADGTDLISHLLNYYQFIILVGVLLHILSGGLKRNTHEAFFMFAFVGGFIFHTIWEAKCQYTISYFWLLIPLSAEGYLETIEHAYSCITEKKSFRIMMSESKRRVLSACVALTTLVLLSKTVLFKDVFLRDEDTVLYSEYVLNNKLYTIQEADYRISPQTNPELYLSINPGENQNATLELQSEVDGDGNLGVIHVYSDRFDEWSILEFAGTDLALGVPSNKCGVGVEIMAYEKNYSDEQHWMFSRKNQNKYTISHNGLALTYSITDGKVNLEENNGSTEQIWVIHKVDKSV